MEVLDLSVQFIASTVLSTLTTALEMLVASAAGSAYH
jgi:hypothetical protein